MGPAIRSAVQTLYLGVFAIAAPRFDVTISPHTIEKPVDGRLIVILTNTADPEPRLQFTYGLRAPQMFAVDVNGVTTGRTVVIGDTAAGHPIRSLRHAPTDRYYIQAVLNIYETVRRMDGHVLKLPMDDGEGQRWTRSPSNLISHTMRVDLNRNSRIRLQLSRVIEPVEQPRESRFIRLFASEASC